MATRDRSSRDYLKVTGTPERHTTAEVTPAERYTAKETGLPSDVGRLLQDLDGTTRYLGESSGATFLDSLKEFIATLFPLAFADFETSLRSPEATFVGSLGFYQTHDSRPLISTPVDAFSIPSFTQISLMLVNLRHVAQDGNGDFLSGGIYYWTDFDQLLRDSKHFLGQNMESDTPSRLATLQAALAVSSLICPLTDSGSSLSSQSCLAKAKTLLGNALDSSSIFDVEVLGLIALYLMEMNRRDSAYMHLCVAAHVLIMNGVHRGWQVDEAGKRLFWTIYTLEREALR